MLGLSTGEVVVCGVEYLLALKPKDIIAYYRKFLTTKQQLLNLPQELHQELSNEFKAPLEAANELKDFTHQFATLKKTLKLLLVMMAMSMPLMLILQNLYSKLLPTVAKPKLKRRYNFNDQNL